MEPVEQSQVAPERAGATEQRRRSGKGSRSRTALTWVRRFLLAVVGAGAGASALVEGYYDTTTWGLVAVGVFAVLLGLVVGTPARPKGPAAVALGAIVVLWLWAWLSTSWAESNDQALAFAGHLELYAGLFAALCAARSRSFNASTRSTKQLSSLPTDCCTCSMTSLASVRA